MDIFASIVTFNPDLERLSQNISAIRPQVGALIIVDNGSENCDQISNLIRAYQRVYLLQNNGNRGIAYALNRAIRYAENLGCEWIVTLDQDSVAPMNLVDVYMKYVDISKCGIVCCKIVDRNFGEVKRERMKTSGYEYVDMCISSASMINVSAWSCVGGFCEKLFIDSVDFDFCLSLREKGYCIIRTYETSLLHEVGHSELRNLFGKEYQIYHHAPVRYYYMERNSLYLGMKHNFFFKALVRNIRSYFMVLLFEDRKFEKLKMKSLGFFHWLINRYGKF